MQIEYTNENEIVLPDYMTLPTGRPVDVAFDNHDILVTYKYVNSDEYGDILHDQIICSGTVETWNGDDMLLTIRYTDPKGK